MARSKFRRAPRFDNLESRQLLSTVSSQGPNSEQQDMLQLLNEARTNPSAAAQEISQNITPTIQATLNYYGVNLQATLQKIASSPVQPPLAWSAQLAQAAQGHSQDMAANQYQSHTGSDGSSPQQRMQQAGYNSATSTGENAYAYASSVQDAMEAFLLDWGVSDDGHRMNIQQPDTSAQNAYRDVGIGLVNSSGTSSVGPLVVTQDFGAQSGEKAQIVGVAYNDPNGTGFYAAGEGVGNVQISAVNIATGQVSSTRTWSSGGYELSLAPGQYQLIASLNNQVINSVRVNVSNVNIEQDFALTNSWRGGSLQAAIASAQPSRPTPVAPPTSVTTPPAPQPATPMVMSAPISAITWNW
jgi:Cysteine-rich secretory protein family/Carboxypeptidase regulatory-like domain